MITKLLSSLGISYIETYYKGVITTDWLILNL